MEWCNCIKKVNDRNYSGLGVWHRKKKKKPPALPWGVSTRALGYSGARNFWYLRFCERKPLKLTQPDVFQQGVGTDQISASGEVSRVPQNVGGEKKNERSQGAQGRGGGGRKRVRDKKKPKGTGWKKPHKTIVWEKKNKMGCIHCHDSMGKTVEARDEGRVLKEVSLMTQKKSTR